MALSDFWRSSLDPERIMRVTVTRWQADTAQQREEQLTVEEPSEIRIANCPLVVIMRTPGNDTELALGFLLTEGIIQRASEVVRIEPALDGDGLPLANVVNVVLQQQRERPAAAAFGRNFTVSASCGLCGRNNIADLMLSVPPLAPDYIRVKPSTIYRLVAHLQAAQTVFSHTGGLHAAALFTIHGELLLLREDVGRHNAVDKLIGHGLLHNAYPYDEHILLVSGRTSFEIIQKALLARIPCVAAISAPSSLAVELAQECGITLVGFLRGHAMNVYTHATRVEES